MDRGGRQAMVQGWQRVGHSCVNMSVRTHAHTHSDKTNKVPLYWCHSIRVKETSKHILTQLSSKQIRITLKISF